MDRRFHKANARVAHVSLADETSAPVIRPGEEHAIGQSFVDLCSAPQGHRDKQMLWGQRFVVLDIHEGYAFGFDPTDGYVGYVPDTALTPPAKTTHRVSTRLAHIYSAPDIKSPERTSLTFYSELALTQPSDGFFKVETGGFIPAQQVRPLPWKTADAATVAELFLGTPYLWGGDTGLGIDCSGLVQLALQASGRTCPRDSDLQATYFPKTNRPNLQRGDLVFWKGHVGMMVNNTDLIHANAHHMGVVVEPLDSATDRIGKKEFGAVTGYARP